MFFVTIVILNVMVGTAQELKAKKLVDELSILNQPKVTVFRDGKETTIAVEDVVKGDQMVLESGYQICNDAVVTFGRMEVDESMLTGESDAIEKKTGDQLFSGSFVIAGRCIAEVTHTGEENYAMQLTTQAKQEKPDRIRTAGFYEKSNPLDQSVHRSAGNPSLPGSNRIKTGYGRKCSGFLRSCPSGHASQGTGTADLCLSCHGCHPSFKNADSGTEYLCAGIPGSCGCAVS